MRLKQPKVVDGVTVNPIAGTHVVMLGFDLAKERRKGCLGFAVQREDAYPWLSRGLMEALVAFVARAESSDYDLHAAYYEFHWPEVLESFREAKRRGAGVHVVYDAMGQKKNNEDAIAETRIKSLCTPRTNGKIMHNKFIVLSHKGQPIAVWTGSTNLSDNGIFGHMNNGHIVEDQAVAEQFLDYWGELQTDPENKKDEQAWVGEHNPNPPDPWDQDLTAIFSPRKGLDVLDWYASEVAGKANEALFMTFAFGMDDRFKDIYRRKDAVLRMALMDKAGSGTHAKRDTAL